MPMIILEMFVCFVLSKFIFNDIKINIEANFPYFTLSLSLSFCPSHSLEAQMCLSQIQFIFGVSFLHLSTLI